MATVAGVRVGFGVRMFSYSRSLDSERERARGELSTEDCDEVRTRVVVSCGLGEVVVLRA